MSKSSRRSRGTTFWRSLFFSTASEQHKIVMEEIERITAMTIELSRALEPLVEQIEKEKTIHPSFYSCVQVLRALDTRKARLQLYREVEANSEIFDVQSVLDAPLVVHTNPLQSEADAQYGIASSNLESFVALFVEVLESESAQLQ